MAFQNDVVGGITLVRPAIRSANYVPGVSGWSINRDGSAEFASGTFRGPVVIIDPVTGNVLASIGATGDGSFQNVTVTGDILIGNISLLDFLTGAGAGIVAQFHTVPPLANSGTASTFVNIMWTQFQFRNDRMYRISVTPTEWTNPNAIDAATLLGQFVINQPGVTGGANNQVIAQSGPIITATPNTTGDRGQFFLEAYLGDATLPSGSMTVALRMATSDVNAFTNVNYGAYPIKLTVEDVGTLPPSTGGTGAPSGSLTWTVQYPAVASRAYDSSGNPLPLPDRDNFIYFGSFPDRPYGNEQSEVIFDGAKIRSDLSGASIVYARLYLYCSKAEEAAGSLGFQATTDTAVQATFNASGGMLSGSYGVDDDWPVPGWFFFNLLTTASGVTALNKFLLSGANGINLTQSLFGLAATGFSGYGNSVSLRPYIEIQYVGNAPGSGGGYGLLPYGQEGYGT